MLTRTTLCGRLPHGPGMCLLDTVTHWDREHITCATDAHQDPANPLRVDDRLPVLAGVEIAAQAVALHIGLAAAWDSPRRGYLAALRDLHWNTERLDDVPGSLAVHATRLGGDPSGASYAFRIVGGTPDHTLLSGRATVMLAEEAA